MRNVIVTPYNQNWPAMFKTEAELLRGIFGPELLDIHHIGSTSVEGLAAKPVIDLLPVCPNIEAIDAFNEAMTAAGYEPKGENGLPGRRFFQKGGDERTHHVHLYEAGHPDIERHLAFRDYVRAHPSASKEYGALKTELANRFPTNMEAYIEGKNEKVLEIERKALDWYRRR